MLENLLNRFVQENRDLAVGLGKELKEFGVIPIILVSASIYCFANEHYVSGASCIALSAAARYCKDRMTKEQFMKAFMLYYEILQKKRQQMH